MRKFPAILLISLLLSSFGSCENIKEMSYVDGLVTPAIRRQILEESGADGIDSIETLVYRKMGDDGIMVIVATLDIRSVENKAINEGLMYAAFTFVYRNNGEMLWTKWQFTPKEILAADFRIPAG